MKKLLLFLFANILLPIFLFAQETQEKGLDEKINEFVQPATDAVSKIVFYPIQFGSTESTKMPIVIIFLLLAATFFTFYFKFVNLRGWKTFFDTVKGKYSDTYDPGEVTHFQALTAALSGTVGLGNIAGVAIAISLGGPGATFWMIVAGFVGMSSKFVECTLGVKYRDIGINGKVFGGPMYYLRKGLAEHNAAGLGKVLAVFFAVMCIGGSFGGGNMFQSNQAAKQFLGMMGTTSGSAGTAFGVVLAIFVGLVIIGGIKRIGSVTEKVVPFMVGIYILSAVIILFLNIPLLPNAFSLIFTEAFSPMAAVGGFVGVMIQGFRRAVFSNEAGVGSAAIAHSAVKTEYPASEGFVAMMGPFIDTVVICTMTALVIIIYNSGGHFDYGNIEENMVLLNATGERIGGVTLTSAAFESDLPWFPYILSVAVVLFAFSTMITWSYYGLQSWLFLFGKTKFNDMLYKAIFLIFIVIGAAASLEAVTDFSDAMIFAMAVPNIIGLMFLLPTVRKEVARYLADIRSGKLGGDKGI